ncbi:MAG: DMT family transporter [Spirochaetia bacterium]
MMFPRRVEGPAAPPLNPRVAVIAGVLFVSSSAILIRLATPHPLSIAFHRMAFAALLTAPRFISAGPSRLLRLSLTDLALALASGAFLALHFASWISSLFLTSVASATVLVNLNPVFVVVLGFVFLGERIGAKAFMWVLVAVAGSVVLALGGTTVGETATAGNLLAIGGAVSVSAYMLIGRFLRPRVDAGAYNMMVYGTSAMFLLLWCVVAGVDLGPYAGREYVLFALLAVFPTLLGHSVFNWALRYVRASFVATSVLGEPVFATILAVFFFAEIPTVWTLAGGAMILTGIYFFTRREAEFSTQGR